MSFPKKLSQKLPEGWSDSADSMSTDELKKVIVDCEGNVHVIERSKDTDTKLNAAKELVKELGGAYRDAKATNVAKIKYCLYLMESRGINIDTTEPSEEE